MAPLKYKLRKQTLRKIIFGTYFKSNECVDLGLVDDVYENKEEL